MALAYAVSSRLGSPEDIRFPVVTASCLLSSIVILLRSRHHGAWRSAPSLGLGMAAIAALSATLLVTDATGSDPPGLGRYEGGFLAAGVLFRSPSGSISASTCPVGPREIVADVACSPPRSARASCPFAPIYDGPASELPPRFALSRLGCLAYGALALARPNVAHLGCYRGLGMCVGVPGSASVAGRIVRVDAEVAADRVRRPVRRVLVSVIPKGDDGARIRRGTQAVSDRLVRRDIAPSPWRGVDGASR